MNIAVGEEIGSTILRNWLTAIVSIAKGNALGERTNPVAVGHVWPTAIVNIAMGNAHGVWIHPIMFGQRPYSISGTISACLNMAVGQDYLALNPT